MKPWFIALALASGAQGADLFRCETKAGRISGTFTIPSSGNPTLKISDGKGSSHSCTLHSRMADAPDKSVAPGFWLSLTLDHCMPKVSDQAREKFLSNPNLVGKWRGDKLESRLQWVTTEEPAECKGQPASRKQLEAYLRKFTQKS